MMERTGQIRLLTRHFFRRFLDNDLISPVEDLHAPIAAVLSGLLIGSAAIALMSVAKYNPRGPQALAEKLALALNDKTLLLAGAMIVMALVAVIEWEALSLDTRDYAILGPLPVPAAMLLAAKTASLAGLVALAALAINLLPALLFPLVVLAKAKVGLGYGLQAMAAHAIAGIAGCVCIFLALVSLRGLVVIALPGRAARRVLAILQFALVPTLLTLLIVLPLLSMKTRPAVEAGSRWLAAWPPLWFLGLEEVLIGRREPVFGELARLGVGALAVTLTAAAAVYLVGFLRDVRRRGPEGASTSPYLRMEGIRDQPASRASGGGLLRAIFDRFGTSVIPDDLARASYFFTAQIFARSPLHRLVLAGYLGLGFAVACGLIAMAYAGIPLGRGNPLSLDYMALTAQVNLLFFLLAGVRVAATFPVELDAAWVFRLHATASLQRHLAGTRAAVMTGAVAPLLLLLAPVHVVLWGWYPALVHLACGVIFALLLLEWLFAGFERLPFVSAYTPARTVLPLRLPVYALGYVFAVYVAPLAERLLMDRPGLAVAWVGALVVVVNRLMSAQSPRYRRDRVPLFDEESAIQRLGIGQAVFSQQEREERAASRAHASRGEGRPAVAMDVPPEPSGGPDTAGVARWRLAVEQLRQELGFSLRRLRTAPGFTAFAIVTLALGIGATTAIYSVIHTAILRPLDIRNIDRLVNIYHSNPRYGSNQHYISLSLPDYRDLQARQTVFAELTAWTGFRQVLVGGGSGEAVFGEMVDGNYFHVLRVEAALGRTLQPADERAGAPPVIVLADSIWRRKFAADPHVVGKTVQMNGRAFEVVGVAPRSFRGVAMPKVVPTIIWVPLGCASYLSGDFFYDSVDDPNQRELRWLMVKGRLRPGRTVSQAAAEVETIGRGLDHTYPIGRDLPRYLQAPPDVTRRWHVSPAGKVYVHESVDGVVRTLTVMTMVAVALVLLVACTNLANLVLARGASRRQELAVRLALGASRARLVREQLVEGVVVTALGGVAALLAAKALMAGVMTTTMRLGAGVALDVEPTFTVSVALVALVATALALLVFGLAPTLHVTRTDVRSALASDASGCATPRWRARRHLIAGQVAVSVALMAIAALSVRHIVVTARHETGIDLDRLAIVTVDFRLQGWDEDRARPTLDRLLDRARGAPGVEAAAVTSALPVGVGNSARITSSDRPFLDHVYSGYDVRLVAATPSIFRTLGVAIRRGRALDERDGANAGRVVLLSELAAQKAFGAIDAVGRDVLVRSWTRGADGPTVESRTVVGIAEDTDSGPVGRRDRGVMYVPFAQHYEPIVRLVARASGDAGMLVGTLRQVTNLVAPDLGITDAATGLAVTGSANVPVKIMASVAGLLGLLALVLAMAGLYGVLSYVVTRRTREMGVRVALGATPGRVMRLVFRDGMWPVLEGLVIGLTLADLTGMALRPVFVRILPSIDPLMYTVVPVPFLVAACLACYLPARRAAAADPNVALRQL